MRISTHREVIQILTLMKFPQRVFIRLHITKIHAGKAFCADSAWSAFVAGPQLHAQGCLSKAHSRASSRSPRSDV